jgi:hypothetical protein
MGRYIERKQHFKRKDQLMNYKKIRYSIMDKYFYDFDNIKVNRILRKLNGKIRQPESNRPTSKSDMYLRIYE